MGSPTSGTPPYVELHSHSAYSFLDGVSQPQELAYGAGRLGHVALALTDHNSVSGSMEFARIAGDAGVRAIHGAEVDVVIGESHHIPRSRAEGVPRSRTQGGAQMPPEASRDTRHLTLLARDARGWSNLCRIITHAHAHT